MRTNIRRVFNDVHSISGAAGAFKNRHVYFETQRTHDVRFADDVSILKSTGSMNMDFDSNQFATSTLLLCPKAC